MKPSSVLCAMALLGALSSAMAGGLPEPSAYRGEIRRDANGHLVAEPVPASDPADGEPAPKTAPRHPAAATAKSAPMLPQAASEPRLIRVGPQQAVHSLAAAARLAGDGDTIEVDSGDYIADVAIWKQAKLTIRGIGPNRPRLIADGANAEGKGIWVVRGGEITVENLEFRDARVADRNGAGIRFEKGYLTIRNCKFENNENGILTAGGANMYLDIENSEFGHNGAGDGRSHNLYVGEITRLRVKGSYFHHARVGHLFKSRAEENHVFYNRLSDEIDGRASYELEFPNGGIAYVVGNLIEQSSQTENSNIVSFGAEGYKSMRNELYLVNNTIVDDRPSNGNILAMKPGAQKLVALNNILVSRNKINPNLEGQISNNPNADWDQFVLPQRFDYRLKAGSSLLGKYMQPPTPHGVSLVPQREYAHPAGSRALSVPVRNPGAFQTLPAKS
ncbi:MAG: hypothetical protein KGL40_02750 [Rhodocyclaceae bacterium]|nr:hypothetical protein [Rhodocyclaceae bacterium]